MMANRDYTQVVVVMPWNKAGSGEDDRRKVYTLHCEDKLFEPPALSLFHETVV